MRMVVDLPAPLLPRNPKISPRPTENERSSTATKAPNRRVRCWTSIAGMVGGLPGGSAQRPTQPGVGDARVRQRPGAIQFGLQ